MPRSATALVDYYTEHPEVVRLAAWHQLESGDRPMPEAIRKSLQEKVAMIEEAQAAGRLTTTYPADGLLTMILSVADTAADAGPIRPEDCAGTAMSEHMRMVIAAVAAILAG
jgi:Tetracyclin repressor-like, C-terminal domain